MDIDGIDLSIVYPTLGLGLYSAVPDSELLSSIFRAYNDWVGEFCSAVPKRIKGIAMLNMDDVRDGVKELERCAKMGFVGAMISIYPPDGRSYNKPEYEPLWAAAQDLGMPLSLHVGTNRPGVGQEIQELNLDTVSAAFTCNLDYWVRMSLAHIIFSGAFERYPKLQVGSVEQELSWLHTSWSALTSLTPKESKSSPRSTDLKRVRFPATSFTVTYSLAFRKMPWV